MLKRAVLGSLFGIAILVLAIQLLPFGRDHTNPPVQAEPQWDSPQTRALAERSCFDCHSNQTVWPWYSNIAPLSWVIQRDVDRGRRELNFSEWNRPQREAGKMTRPVERGEMPQWYYILLHPAAKLTPQETQALIQGLNSTAARR